MSLDWDDSVGQATTAVGERVLTIADPSCLRQTRERPFEVALAGELNQVLPGGRVAQTGGTPALGDFAALGPYDVSVPRLGPGGFETALEFKWWGPPGNQSLVPAKRNETLWDALKLACSIASGRADFGYLVVLAPDAAWQQEHAFARLFDGEREWETAVLCRASGNPMKFFDQRHYGVTAVPRAIAARLVGSRTTRDPCHNERWTLKAVAIEPRGPMGLLPRSPSMPSASVNT